VQFSLFSRAALPAPRLGNSFKRAITIAALTRNVSNQ
jgi:hypothetical protein